MNSQPLVSILMNCYNGSKYIKESIESVLAQTYKNWELIIWDNRSKDQSLSIINKFKKNEKRIKVFISDKHTDLGGGRAAAWKHLNGKYLVILDTDDLFSKTKIEKQVNCLEKNPEYGICISNSKLFSSNKSKVLYSKVPPINMGLTQLIEKYYISLVSVMICLDKAKMSNMAFDDKFSHIADFDLIIRLCSKYKLIYLNEILSGWRVHSESLTWKQQDKFYYELINWTNYYLDHDLFKNYKKSIIKLKNKSITNLFSEKIISFEFNESLNLIKQEKKILIYFLPYVIFNILKRILINLNFKRKWN